MEIHIAATFPDTNPAITNFIWSDGAWVSFNADTKQWANHGFIPHPSVHPAKFGAPNRLATDALEVVPLADAPEYPTAVLVDPISLQVRQYRVNNGVLEYQTPRGTWWESSYDVNELRRDHLPAAAPLIAALTAEPPRHSAECADAD